MKKNISLLLLFFYFFQAVALEEDSTKSIILLKKSYINSYLKDSKEIIASPLKWEKKDLLFSSGVAAFSSFLIWKGDRKINDFTQSNRSVALNNFATYGLEPWGDGPYSISLMGIFYLFGNLNNNDKAVETAYLGLKTFIVTAGLTYIPKELFHRQRPNAGDNHLVWNGPIKGWGNHSFPSGHSMSAFAMATVISSQYSDKKIIPVIAYSIASLTAMSRVYQNYHWSSDIVIGSVLGYTMAKIICKKNNWRISTIPYFIGSSRGVTFSYRI